MKSFREQNPEGAKMWAYDLNAPAMTPDTVSGGSEKTAYFRCLNNPAHVFQKKIAQMTSRRDGHNVGCIYCGKGAKTALKGETDLLTMCPEAKVQWDWSKNIGLNPTKLLPQSNKYAYFTCKNSHTRRVRINNFIKHTDCPICKERIVLIAQVTNLALFWREDKNKESDVRKITRNTRKTMYLKCPKCRYEWKWLPSTWISKPFCPCCGYDGTENGLEKNKAAVEENHIITFRMSAPAIAELWRYDLNGEETPDSIVYCSNKRFTFTCKKGHTFTESLDNISRYKYQECPYCEKGHTKSAITGVNDVMTLVPQVKLYWDWERNMELNPEKLLPSSRKKAYFKCEKGHSYETNINGFVRGYRCPECKEEQNALLQQRKTFKKIQMVFQKVNPCASLCWCADNEVLPSNVTIKSNKTVKLQCPSNPAHIFAIKICNIPKEAPYGCPYCTSEKVFPGETDLLTVHPEIKSFWDWERNTDLEPTQIGAGSGKDANFMCSDCGYRWKQRIAHFSSTLECPSCKRKEKLETRSVAAFPHMMKQWNWERNSAYDPNQIFATADTTVWWKCPKCEYEWQAQISSRKVSRGLCPCCEVRIVVTLGVNDLFTLIPELEDYFDPELNPFVDPTLLSVSTLKPIHWLCPECGYDWTSSVQSRIIGKDPNGGYVIRKCPVCSGTLNTTDYLYNSNPYTSPEITQQLFNPWYRPKTQEEKEEDRRIQERLTAQKKEKERAKIENKRKNSKPEYLSFEEMLGDK